MVNVWGDKCVYPNLVIVCMYQYHMVGTNMCNSYMSVKKRKCKASDWVCQKKYPREEEAY